MLSHETFMSRCLDLAINGLGAVSPNPMVGAVLVHEGRIIGEGYHEEYGRAHAEVRCINNVKEQDKPFIRNSTLYVSLEPCAHHGKTPPCADLIIANEIKHVVTGSADPNPLVAGRGIAKLRHAGVEVTEHVLKRQCDFLNRRFITFHTLHRPYIILKWAQSADGFFAPDGDKQQWLTDDYSRRLVHRWRTEEDAVLVGARTALIDDPQLTARSWPGRNPVRILIDMDLRVHPVSRIFDDQAMTIVYNGLKEGLEYGTVYVMATRGGLPQQIASDLYHRHIQGLIIEGGAYTLSQFIAAGLWDEARILSSPTLLSSGTPAPRIEGTVSDEQKLSADTLIVKHNSSL